MTILQNHLILKKLILRINNLLKRAYDNPSKIQIDGYDN